MSLSQFLVAALPEGERYRLDGPEGHHAAVVQRLRVGESLLLSDGAGGVAECVVSAVARGVLDVAVARRFREAPPSPRLIAVQALAKGDRGELAIQMLTEAGVDEIVPWRAARSVVRWQGDRGARAYDRWRSVVREAAKQARRAWLPAVAEPAGTDEVTRRLADATVGLVLHEEAVVPLAAAALPEVGDVVFVVGPEGGVAPDELAAFREAGAMQVRLGANVLRTSTAGVAALAILNARTGRWG